MLATRCFDALCHFVPYEHDSDGLLSLISIPKLLWPIDNIFCQRYLSILDDESSASTI
jgi:hypothetical protein